MSEEKKYTLDELKEKLLQLTTQYVNLENYNNLKATEIKSNIDIIINSIYWHEHNSNNNTNNVLLI